MSDKLAIWNAVRTPPQTALKEIRGGRLNGMTDISPQWRMQILTEQFGPAGIGWTYEITRQWTEEGPKGQVGAFTNINLYVNHDGAWSRAIPGTGGSMLVAEEKAGLHYSDEAFKMSTTDAISVAAKALGVGADVYMGQLDSKYQRQGGQEKKEVSEERQEINNRIRRGLFAIGCETQEQAAAKVKEMTTFEADGKTIPGKSDYKVLSDKAAKFLAERLEKMKPSEGPSICAECGDTMDGDRCTNPNCPGAPF